MKKIAKKSKLKQLYYEIGSFVSSASKKRKLPYIFLVMGLVLIIAGLLIIVFWQRGFIRLVPLECPEFKNLYV